MERLTESAKFNFTLDGNIIKNIQDLQQHVSIELLEYFNDCILTWLEFQNNRADIIDVWISSRNNSEYEIFIDLLHALNIKEIDTKKMQKLFRNKESDDKTQDISPILGAIEELIPINSSGIEPKDTVSGQKFINLDVHNQDLVAVDFTKSNFSGIKLGSLVQFESTGCNYSDVIFASINGVCEFALDLEKQKHPFKNIYTNLKQNNIFSEGNLLEQLDH